MHIVTRIVGLVTIVVGLRLHNNEYSRGVTMTTTLLEIGDMSYLTV